MKAADSGKHILLDKPTAVNSTELLQIIFCCQMQRVLLMDGYDSSLFLSSILDE